MLAGPTQPTNTAEATGTSGDQEQASAYRGNELTKALLLGVLGVLYSLNRNTTDRLPTQVQTIKHATPENYHLNLGESQTQPTNTAAAGGGRSSSVSEKQRLRQAERDCRPTSAAAAAAAARAAACTRGNRYTRTGPKICLFAF